MTVRPGSQEVKEEDKKDRCDGHWPAPGRGKEKPGEGTERGVGLAQVNAAASC